MSPIFYLSAILLLISFALTWATRKFSLKNRILDIPNERSSHSEPTPRGGGIAIVITWYIGLSVLFILGNVEKKLFFALLSGIILAVFSLIDDIINLRPSVRIIAQTITVILAFYFLKGIQPFSLFNIIVIPTIVMYPIVIIGMVWFINLYNFLDGIDGYASFEAITLTGTLFLFSGGPVFLILLVSVMGFLFWNWPKAKIFMGDVGSTQIGFILIVLGLYYHNKEQFLILYWILLTAPFWFDATLTLFRRWKNKEKLSQAHRKHIYQRLVQSGFSHLKVDILLTFVNLIIIALVYMCQIYHKMLFPTFLFVISLLYLIAKYTDKRKAF